MTRKTRVSTAQAPQSPDERSARAARLRYVKEFDRGITRQKSGRSFRYIDSNGRSIRDLKRRNRIRSLVIPPAWKDVWICPLANGHIQATGIDQRGRRQYLYHKRWRQVRDDAKYQKLLRFAQALPGIRRRVGRHLKQGGLPKEKVMACVVKLLETTLIRVGNDEYAESNHSYGLTTMRDHHVTIKGRTISFDFVGKSKVKHEIQFKNSKLAPIVRKIQQLPGRELFQYLDEEGKLCDVTSQDVNDYIKDISGDDFTAKDFRTWAATLLAALALKEFEDCDTQVAAKRNIRSAIEKVAQKLGNTSAVCRKSYIHPEILAAYMDHSLISTIQQRAESVMCESMHQMSAEEGAVLALLKQRIERKADRRKHAARKSTT